MWCAREDLCVCKRVCWCVRSYVPTLAANATAPPHPCPALQFFMSLNLMGVKAKLAQLAADSKVVVHALKFTNGDLK